MYFVNHEQIEQRLQFMSVIVKGCEQITSQWETNPSDLMLQLAQERIIQLAIESVTDVGSLLIDGFVLRDASSYDDIIEILKMEQVFEDSISTALLKLVKLRRPLVQEYVSWDRGILHPLTKEMIHILPVFADDVRAFIRKELA
ncbi:hypothetical protein D3C73_557800 [compost metagenome]